MIFLLVILISGCASEPEFDAVYTGITEGTLKAGSEIPQPAEEVILTVTGQIGALNEDESIVMDLPTIESLGVVEYTVLDPFEEVETTYQGVLMRDLLELWQVSEEATTLELLALNDYRIEVPLEIVRDYPVIFAFKQNDEYMKPDYRGPGMLVFPYSDYDFERPATDAYWIWQIKAIEVK
jgi:hypothetical protein